MTALARMAATPRPSLGLALCVGLTLAAIAIAVRALIGLAFDPVVPYATVAPAVLGATLLAGRRAGWAALVAGDTGAWLLYSPGRRSILLDATDAVSLVLAAGAMAAILELAARYRDRVRAQADARRRAAEAQQRLFERSTGFAAVFTGPEMRVTYANPAWLRTFDVAAENLGSPLLELRPQTSAETLEAIRQVMSTGETVRRLSHPWRRETAQGEELRYADITYQPLRDEAERLIGVFCDGHDVTETVRSAERLALVAREVDHRANNLLAVVQSVLALTRADDVESYRQAITGRIHALARAHQLLAASRWEGASLRRIVEEELTAYDAGEGRTTLIGADLSLPPAAAQALAMAVHELATNAAKFGAFSSPGGQVEVSWVQAEGEARLTWREHGGPPVASPSREGTGSRVLRLALTPVGGRTSLDWRAEGLVAEISWPLNTEACGEGTTRKTVNGLAVAPSRSE